MVLGADNPYLHCTKSDKGSTSREGAERVRFELTVPLSGTDVFKTSALGHYATSPGFPASALALRTASRRSRATARRRRRVQDSNLWTTIHRHGLASRSITALATLQMESYASPP